MQFLSEHHPQSFHVWNLDVAFYNPELLQGRVTHCGWPDHHAPLLPHLCAIVDQMAEFLAASVNNVCVVHCLAGKGRSGTVCSAFLARTQAMSASDALAAFGVARCVDGSGVAQPSQIRYVHYVHLMDRLGVLVRVRVCCCYFHRCTYSQSPAAARASRSTGARGRLARPQFRRRGLHAAP